MGSVRLSPKHGVNPSVMTCFFCGEAKGVALLGLIPGDKEAPRQAVYDREPCDTCKGHMALGVICISVDESKTDDMTNPYRSGGWVVLKDEAFARIFTGEAAAAALKCRVCFMADDAWDRIGLPRGAAK